MGIVVEERFEVDAGGAAVFAWLGDLPRVARCLPAAQVGDAGDDGRLAVEFTVPLGAATTTFAAQARLTTDEAARSATLELNGEERGGVVTVQLLLASRVEETTGGSDVVIRADVTLAGEIHPASAREAAANDLVQRIVDCMFRTLAGPPMTTPPRRAREDLTDLDLGLEPPPQSPVAAASLQDTALNLPAATRPLPPPDPSVDVPQLQRTMSIPAAKRPASMPASSAATRAAARDRTAVSPRSSARQGEPDRRGLLARLAAALGRLFGKR